MTHPKGSANVFVAKFLSVTKEVLICLVLPAGLKVEHCALFDA